MTTCLRYDSPIVGAYVSTKWFRCNYGPIYQSFLGVSGVIWGGTYLNGQRGFAYGPVPQYHQLVCGHFPRNLEL